MKRGSVLDKQSIKRNRQKGFLLFKKTLGQLGFGFIKIFLFLLGLGAISLAFISGYQFLASSSYFRLNNIVVTGVNDDLKGELIEISGIKGKESLFSIDPVTIKTNIEGHPWIKSVFLRKEFPNTLYIKAEDEEAVAIVVLEKMYLMNRDGILFKEVEKDDRIDFPVITGLSTVGNKNEGYLKRAASFLNALCLNDAPLSIKELSEVHVGEDGTLSIYLNKLSFKVFFGKDGFLRKIDALNHIVKHLRDSHRLYQARSIDLDYKDRAIVGFIG